MDRLSSAYIAMILVFPAGVSSAESFDTEAVMGEARMIPAQFQVPGANLEHENGPLGGRRSRPGEARNPVASCRTDDGINLNLRGVSMPDLLDLLEHAPAARPAVAQFRANLAAGRVSVVQITDEIRASIPNGNNVMASYQYQPGRAAQQILVDLDAELGVLAVQFYHEMTHNVDPDLPVFYDEFDRRYPQIQAALRAPYESAARRLGRRIDDVGYGDLNRDEKIAYRRAKLFENDSLWAIESRAFSAQHIFIRQLIDRAPCYDAYLTEQQTSNGLRTRYPNIPEHLYCAYGLYPPGVPLDIEPGVGCALDPRWGGPVRP